MTWIPVLPLPFYMIYRKKLSLWFAHLTTCRIQVIYMEPVITPLMTDICLALGNLVCMVRKNIVNTASWSFRKWHEYQFCHYRFIWYVESRYERWDKEGFSGKIWRGTFSRLRQTSSKTKICFHPFIVTSIPDFQHTVSGWHHGNLWFLLESGVNFNRRFVSLYRPIPDRS